MEMENQNQNCHQEQSTFIHLYKSENGLKIRNRNNYEEESCWSDSQKLEESEINTNRNSPNLTNFQIINQPNYNGLDKKGQLNEIDSEQQLRRNILTKQYSRKRLTHISKNQELSSDNNQVSTIMQSQKLQFDAEEQTIWRTHTYVNTRKMLTSVNQSDHMNKFKSKLRLFARIAIQMKYFIKNFTNISRTKLLNKKIRKIVQDLGDVIAKKKEGRQPNLQFFVLILKFFKKFNIKLIDPQSMIGFAIKLLITFINSIFLFIFSIFIIFQVHNSFERSLKFSMFMIWVLEIILNLNTKIYKAPIVISKRIKIFKFYLKNRALFDLFPLFLLIFIDIQNIFLSITIDVMVFCKISNLIKDQKEVQLQLCMKVRRYYLVQLFNLISKLFFIAHIIACSWYLISIIEQKYLGVDQSWQDDIISQDKIWWKMYLSSLYWSLTLMTTGSNTSITILQTFFTTFIMLFTSITYGYILNIIGIILSEMDQKGEDKRRDINVINEYMKKKNISSQYQIIYQQHLLQIFNNIKRNLQARVNLHLEYYYENTFSTIQLENLQVLDKISSELKDQMSLEYNKQILNKIDFLNSKFSTETLNDLLLHFKEEFYFPNDIIYNQKEIEDQSLMYIIQGEGNIQQYKINKQISIISYQIIVEIVYQSNLDFKSQTRIEKIKSGEIFGQYGFFTGIARDFCAKSTKFTQIMKIDRKTFIEVLQNREKEFQEFCQIKDKILMYRQHEDINMKCLICNTSSHLISNCAIVNFNRDATQRLMGVIEKETQKRNQIIRKKRLRIKSLCMVEALTTFTQQYIFNLRKECNSVLQKIDIQPSVEETLYSNQDNDEINSSGSYRSNKSDENVDDEEESNQAENRDTVNGLTETDINFRKSLQNSQNRYEDKQMNALQKSNIIPIRKSISINDHEVTYQYYVIQNLIHFIQQELIQAYESIKYLKKEISEQDKQIPLSSETIRLTNLQKHSTRDIENLKNSITHDYPNQEGNLNDERLEPANSTNSKKIALRRQSIKKGVLMKNQSKLSFVENPFDTQKSSTYQKLNVLLDMLTLFIDKDKTVLRNNTNQSVKFQQQQSTLKQSNIGQIQEFNPWLFDQLKDYKYYFPMGNSKIVLARYGRTIKKRNRFTRKATFRR